MKFVQKTIREVNYNDLDKAVNEFLKKNGVKEEYECVAHQEWGNSESHSFGVRSAKDEDTIKAIKEGDLSFQLRNILNWMCFEGEILPGEYIISVSW